MTDPDEKRYPFVLLYHELPVEYAGATGRGSHWDLMVATDHSGSLRTWAIETEPDFGQNDDFSVAALPLADHRREYLEYEGPVSDDRGRVTREEAGIAEWEDDSMGRERLRLTLGDRVWQASFCSETQRMEFVRE